MRVTERGRTCRYANARLILSLRRQLGYGRFRVQVVLHVTRTGFVAPTADYPFDYKSFDARSMTGSYIWVFDGKETKGAQHGNCYIGTQPDVCTINFYEDGPLSGISLLVAKNVTFFFESWFSVRSLSEFDPKQIDDESKYYHNTHDMFIMEHDTSNTAETVQRSLLVPMVCKGHC